jgi:hypothetical protein
MEIRQKIRVCDDACRETNYPSEAPHFSTCSRIKLCMESPRKSTCVTSSAMAKMKEYDHSGGEKIPNKTTLKTRFGATTRGEVGGGRAKSDYLRIKCQVTSD